jgi:sulfur relay (sulfurtransferase) DsrC/TusE family protein
MAEKTKASYFTNSKEIREVVDRVYKNFPFKPLEEMKPDEHCTLFLFDSLFYDLQDKSFSEEELLQIRPEWQQDILPLLKNKEKAFVFTNEWYTVVFHRLREFYFIRHLPPTLERNVCLLATRPLASVALQQITRLFECYGTAQAITTRFGWPIEFEHFCDYKTLCWKLAGIIKETEKKYIKERNVWWERCDYLLETVLCDDCSEKKDKIYRRSEDQECVKNWIPGNCCQQYRGAFTTLGAFDYSSDEDDDVFTSD